ncbi:deoxyribodipyrimidine photo-lyase, partial [Mycobacteroides abscessus]|uniref:deoxyribodipyrimidine photo-lyase n=1 Tax=Mycobacteroides abscessus TaxID=36809 RepID=UPI000A80D1D6
GALVWLREDLRLADNPALRAGIDHGGDLTVVVVLDEESHGIRPLGAASRWWLHHSLTALDAELRDRGSRLVLRRGPAADVVHRLEPYKVFTPFWRAAQAMPEPRHPLPKPRDLP